MAADNKTNELSVSQTNAAGNCVYSNCATEVNRTELLTGASVGQSFATSCPQPHILDATAVRILPTVHVSRHPFAACMPSSASMSGCLSSPMSSGERQGNSSVFIHPLQQQQSVVSRTVPTVRQPAPPTAVLDLGNNGILNAVLRKLPNVGTMVVQSLDPQSLVQRNIVAVIDSGTNTATTATSLPVVNLPVLTLPCQGAMAFQYPQQAVSPITHASQASTFQNFLHPVIVNRTGLRQQPVHSNVTTKQRVAFSQSPGSIISTCSHQRPLLNPSINRPMVMVRTVANSSGQNQLNLSVSPVSNSRFLLMNSAETVPQIKLPHTTSSLSDAIVRYHTTTGAQVLHQRSALVAAQSVSQIEPNASLPVPTQLIAAVPSLVTDLSSTSNTDVTLAALTLPPSDSFLSLIHI